MSLAEIKGAVKNLSQAELAELAAFIRARDNAAWDQEIDADFAEGGRLRSVANQVQSDIRGGRGRTQIFR